jgi:prepilin-type N-terminal cleavage/methylation domain-containing protein
MKKFQHGFTIIELLVVIVVIAILASITYVSYAGVQNKSKTNGGLTLAQSVGSKVDQYYQLNGSYPNYCQITTNTTDASGTGASGSPCAAGAASAGDQAKLDSTAAVAYASDSTGTGYTAALSNNNAVIGYWLCTATTSTGVDIFYIDYTNASAITTYKVGTGC